MAKRQAVDGSLQGKRVLTSDGEDLGTVASVRSGTMYVDLDPGIGDRVLARIGWDAATQTDYPLRTDEIERVTADTVHLGDL